MIGLINALSELIDLKMQWIKQQACGCRLPSFPEDFRKRLISFRVDW